MKRIRQFFYDIKQKKYLLCIISFLFLTVLCNLAACSKAFCDGYTDTVYRILSDVLGRGMDFLPFSAGEFLMYLGAALLLFSLLLFLLIPVLKRSLRSRRFLQIYFRCILFCLVFSCFSYTICWVIPFRSNLLGEKGHFEKQYSVEELHKLWKYVVDHLNEVCMQVERDEEGHILYQTKEKTEAEVADAMKKISDRYPRLTGYYPKMKPALCSDVLEWMQIGGYTYPYTMEITYNRYISDLYFPSLYAHESSHHQGYYQENEANFLSYLSCSGSEDPILRYSAYHTIYFYVDDAYASALYRADADPALTREYGQTMIDRQVQMDEKEERRKREEAYASDAHPLQQYSEVAEDVSDVGWNTQSEILESNGYDGVVQLLLEYYDGILY